MGMQLTLSSEEAEYVSDILQMWMEGIEAEIPNLVQPSPEVHWSRYQLRKQLDTARSIRMRIKLQEKV